MGVGGEEMVRDSPEKAWGLGDTAAMVGASTAGYANVIKMQHSSQIGCLPAEWAARYGGHHRYVGVERPSYTRQQGARMTAGGAGSREAEHLDLVTAVSVGPGSPLAEPSSTCRCPAPPKGLGMDETCPTLGITA